MYNHLQRAHVFANAVQQRNHGRLIGGVATLPTGGDDTALGKLYGLSFSECVSWCCSTAACAAVAFYDTDNEGLLCQGFTMAFSTGPQPFPDAHVRFAQGVVLAVSPAAEDDVANGLRSGTWLGGLGTGGYELRADGRANADIQPCVA
jgi:hypothetical protein